MEKKEFFNLDYEYKLKQLRASRKEHLEQSEWHKNIADQLVYKIIEHTNTQKNLTN